MTGQDSSRVRRGPSKGPVRFSGARWARLNFGGENKRWHAVLGKLAICKQQRFDYARVEYSDTKPKTGVLCKRCVAMLAADGGV